MKKIFSNLTILGVGYGLPIGFVAFHQEGFTFDNKWGFSLTAIVISFLVAGKLVKNFDSKINERDADDRMRVAYNSLKTVTITGAFIGGLTWLNANISEVILALSVFGGSQLIITPVRLMNTKKEGSN